MRRLGPYLCGIISVIFILSPLTPTHASDVDFTMEIYPESHRDQYYHGSCCQGDQLSNHSNFPMYQQFTPTTVNRITKINLEFYGNGNEDYTIYLTDHLNNRISSATSNIQVAGMIEFLFATPIALAESDTSTIYQIELTPAAGSWSLAYDDLGDYKGGHAKTSGTDYMDKDYHFEIWGYFVEPQLPEEEEEEGTTPSVTPVENTSGGYYVPAAATSQTEPLKESEEEGQENLVEILTEIVQKFTEIEQPIKWLPFLLYVIPIMTLPLVILVLVRKERKVKSRS